MKATLVDSIPTGSWLYEIKFDGYRALALRGGNQTRILSRNQKDLGKKFQIIADSPPPTATRSRTAYPTTSQIFQCSTGDDGHTVTGGNAKVDASRNSVTHRPSEDLVTFKQHRLRADARILQR